MWLWLVLATNVAIVASFEINFENADFDCLKRLAQSEFNAERETVMVTDSHQIFIPEGPVKIVTMTKIPEISDIKNSIIFTDSESHLSEIFPKLDRKFKHVIVTQDLENIPKFLNLAREYQIPKLAVIQAGNLFYRGNRHDCSQPPRIIQGDCHKLDFSKTKFPNCIFKVGYITSSPFVINITTLENPGIMVAMTRLISRLMGVKMVFENSTLYNYELLNNGTLDQLGKDLETGKIDLAIGRLFMNASSTTPFDFGPLYTHEQPLFTVPKPKKLKSYKKLFVVFEMEIWKNIFMGVWIMVGIFYIFGLFEDFHNTTIVDTVFDVFYICIGGGIAKMPQWLSFRILLTFFFLFCLSMDSIYLGNLSQIFGFSSYEILVDDVNKVKATNTKFEISWRIERLYLMSYVTRGGDGSRQAELLHIKNYTQAYLLNSTAFGKENGTCIYGTFIDVHPSHVPHLDFFIPGTDYMTMFITTYSKKNSIFFEESYFWSLEIIEKGFTQKWLNDIKYSNTQPELLPEDEENLVVLKLAHFEESFTVLVGGYVLAVIGLVLEFVFLKLDKIGVVKLIKENVIFVVMLLKPPELNKKKEEKGEV